MMFSQLVEQSPWLAAGNCSHVQFITPSLPPPPPRFTMCYTKQNSHQTFLNRCYQKISNTAFLSLTSEQNQNKPNYIEKKSEVKTESPLGKQKSQGNPAGLKCRSQVRLQVTGQTTGHRSGHRSDHRSHTKTIGHWTKLFLIDISLYKNKTRQGTSIIFFLF